MINERIQWWFGFGELGFPLQEAEDSMERDKRKGKMKIKWEKGCGQKGQENKSFFWWARAAKGGRNSLDRRKDLALFFGDRFRNFKVTYREEGIINTHISSFHVFFFLLRNAWLINRTMGFKSCWSSSVLDELERLIYV